MYRQLPNAPRSPAPGCPLPCETGQPPGFGGDGWGQPGNFPAGLFPENFQPDFLEKFLADFVEKISGKI
jgi:hypothetical protein